MGFGAPNVCRSIGKSYCACHLMPTVVSLIRADPMISIYYFFASGPPTPSRMPGYCRGVVPSRPDAPNRCFSKGFQLKSKLFPSPAAPEPPRRSKPLFFYMYDPLMLTPRLVIPDPYLSSSSCAVCTVLGGIPSRNQMRWDAHQVIHLEPLDDGLSHTTFSNNR